MSGLGFKDGINIVDYWGKIPDFLKAHGCDVYTSYQDAFNSHSDNAIILKHRIVNILEKSQSDKINIIAHSKGGLESRYMISKLGMDKKVASLTMLGTPNRGTSLADIIIGKIPLPKFTIARLVNIYAKMIGDKRPDSMRAAVQLTKSFMKVFNEDVLDVEDVYYQTFASHVTRHYPNILWRTLAGILYAFDGENDGLVSIESAQWGHYRGLIKTLDCPSVSHADMVGLKQFRVLKQFKSHWFFVNIIHELKEMGY
ncbi:MAG: hypothetical protein M9887_05490 [Chitinophagales bacterium]|nr:hypothetical protein [Chitinophagales bacterium]